MRLAGIMLAALAISGAALAQERPPITPTRDVDVTYRVPQAEAGPAAARILEQRMRYSANLRRQRVDPPTPGLYVIMDFAAHRMSTIRPAERMALDMPTPADSASAQPFARKGDVTIAGNPCTEWLTRDAAGEATLVCITADGVMLRAAAAGRLLVEATSVRYETQDPSLFAVPPGFSHITAPTR